MKQQDFEHMPYMLYADSDGQVYEHPYFRMAGYSGSTPMPFQEEDLIAMPEFSKLFYIPDCPPIGFDPANGQYRPVPEVEMGGRNVRCFAVATFLEPGLVRSLLPAADYRSKSYILPTWAYTAVGFKDDKYRAVGFRIEYNDRWDPRNYDDRELVPAIEKYQREFTCGALVDHLIHCATNYHCFAAKNLFLQRWEAPLPISRGCNADCLGCLSLQSDQVCQSSHQRIAFKPAKEEIVSLAVAHLNRARDAIVSFGQGCEGEPLTEYRLIADSIREIRTKTNRGTVNLNTNGSWPGRIREIARCGLDSIRISLSSARPEYYHAYYRPKDYSFDDVAASISLSTDLGLYTMINYLVFPGISDQEAELEALIRLIRKTRVNFIHLKNLNIDPHYYLERMPEDNSRALGMKGMVNLLKQEFPELELGYFNQADR